MGQSDRGSAELPSSEGCWRRRTTPYAKMLLSSASDDEPAPEPAAIGATTSQTGCVFAALPKKVGRIYDTVPPPAGHRAHTIARHIDTEPKLAMTPIIKFPDRLRAAFSRSPLRRRLHTAPRRKRARAIGEERPRTRAEFRATWIW